MGRVLSLVPGTDNWFNVNESQVVSLNLMENVDRGDVLVVFMSVNVHLITFHDKPVS